MPRVVASVIALVLGLGISVGSSPPSWAAPDTGLFLSVLPPGQSGYLTVADAIAFLTGGGLPPHVDDQRQMYAALAQAPAELSDADLLTYFKPAPLGPPDVATSVVTPRPGVTITRDAFGVPLVTGDTREDILFGVGYASAEDRLFFMDVSRRAARGRLSEFLGGFAPLRDFALELDASTYAFAGYSEAELRQQFDDLGTRFRSRGRRVQRDFEAYVEGVNAFLDLVAADPARVPAEYTLLGLGAIEPWTVSDVVAITTQFEAIFGTGGGGEHRNAELLHVLRSELGDVTGTALFQDLRHAEDPEAPVTTERNFPYLIPGAIDPAAVALPDPGSVQNQPALVVSGGSAAAAASRAPAPDDAAVLMVERLLESMGAWRSGRGPAMSNFLAVTRDHGAGGHPAAIMGPQTGYFVPEILVEFGFDGQGLRARGAAPPGFPYVNLGRGRSYAWSATAGGSDTIDVRVERLCEPGGEPPAVQSVHYVFQGVCTLMEVRVDTWCAGTCAPGATNVTATVQRTVHGPVFARATVQGAPVALVKQRASFKGEIAAAVAFMLINRRNVGPRRFARAMSLNPGSFNWLYVGRRNVAFFHSGLYARRAPGVDPDLPSWGTGEYEWDGFLEPREQPADRNPARGFLTSWNNKPARGWRAADSNYSYGSVYRVQSLDERLAAALASGNPITIADLVEIMVEAAFVDLRGSQVLPPALALVSAVAGSDPTLAPALAALSVWHAAGAPRRDRDGDGEYEHTGAIAVIDAWYERMIHAAFDPQLVGVFALIPMGFDDPPNALGSAYQSGYYGYLQKAFRMALNEPVAAPFRVLRCADGTASGCGAALAMSLDAAVAALAAAFGSADPADWRVDPTAEQIAFQPFGIAQVAPMPWMNRPTFQQVVQVVRARPR